MADNAQLNSEKVSQWLAAKAAAARAKVELEIAERKMLEDMGEMLVGICDLGVLTMKQVVSHRIDSKLLRAQFADVAQQVTVESVSVRMNWKDA